jgi:uncharacterized protein YsxB (DUF464 family)
MWKSPSSYPHADSSAKHDDLICAASGSVIEGKIAGVGWLLKLLEADGPK